MGTIYLPLTWGTRNFDGGLSGFFCNTNIPPHTNTNANNVPMLVSAITTFRFINNAGIPTTKPVKIVEKDGVLYLGCILEKILGSKPSLLILIHIRGCPN